MRGWLLFLVLLSGCPEPKAAVVAAPVAVAAPAPDAGPVVNAGTVDAWLRWQQAVLALGPVRRADGGPEGLLARAREEARLLAAAGLSAATADEVEAVVAAVVAERAVARLSGAAALDEFSASLAQLAPERRAKAEAALADLKTKTPASTSTAELEARFGAEAVRAVLTREAEVTKTWDTLLDTRGD